MVRSGEAILEQVLHTIEKFHMIVPGQRIAVACSGGPDSTALLLLLQELSNPLGCVLSVAHFNHRLRAEQSDADEAFVRNLAERLQLPLHVAAADVRSAAQNARVNLEAKARQLRYEFLFALVETGQADRIAVGHTADDQAETVLHRLLRGSGTRGLAGIYPVAEGKLIRPLLQVRHQAVTDWLKARQQPWREDESNQDLHLLRNRLRHQLLPRLSEFNPRILEILSGTSEIARGEEAFWQDYLGPILAQIVSEKEGKVIVDINQLRRTPLAVARRVLRAAIASAARPDDGYRSHSPLPAVAFGHIDRLLTMASRGRSGSMMTLPRNLAARKECQHLILQRVRERAAPALGEEYSGFSHGVQVPAVVEVAEIGRRFAFELMPLGGAERDIMKRGMCLPLLLDSRFASIPLTLRNWRPGDVFRGTGAEKARKLKKFFQACGASVPERQRWPVVVAGQEIIWIRGLGAAEGCAPLPDSEQAILIRESNLEPEI